MSEYAWYVKQIWFGVEGPEPERPMLGIIKRSGQCRAIGHFCHVKVPVNGKKVWAGGAEDRTFYMHLVEWDDIGQKIPKDMIPALGWKYGGNGYCFLHNGIVVQAGGRGSLSPVPPSEWGSWRGDLLTLVQKGQQFMVNHYLALMSEVMSVKEPCVPRKEKPVVTLPVGCFDTEKGKFFGLTGAVSMWNGVPPPWCKQVVEVKCASGWIHVREEHYKVLWERQ